MDISGGQYSVDHSEVTLRGPHVTQGLGKTKTMKQEAAAPMVAAEKSRDDKVLVPIQGPEQHLPSSWVGKKRHIFKEAPVLAQSSKLRKEKRTQRGLQLLWSQLLRRLRQENCLSPGV
jgi:hypothetical protein